MEKPERYLLDFIKTYLKNKDLFFKRIESIEEKEDVLFIKYKQKEVELAAQVKLDENALENLGKMKNPAIVTLNTKDNLNFLLKKWDEIAKHVQLTLYFTNPFSKTERIWTIMPHMHSRIADPQSLKLGLTTMFENVEEADVKNFKKIVEG